MNDDPLLKARRLQVFRRWKKLTLFLEPFVPLYRDSPEFYCLLGTGFLHLQDFDTATNYLSRALQLVPKDRDTGLLLAVSRLGLGQVAEAATICLDILERIPDDIRVRTLMKWIRAGHSCTENEEGSTVLPFRRLMSILPDAGLLGTGRRIAVTVLVVLFLFMAATMVFTPGIINPRKSLTNENTSFTGLQPRIVAADPGKYSDLRVVWHGIASNPQRTSGGKGRFTLVAGSYDLKSVDALIDVVCQGEPPEAGLPVEVEGLIVLHDKSFILMAGRITLKAGGKR